MRLSIENIIKLLEEVNVLCRDNGKKFDKENSQRINVIKEKLSETKYTCTSKDLFLLFHKKELNKKNYGDDTILISTHIDCEAGITNCFSKQISNEMLLGTYDNSITNAAIIYLMMEDKLPDNVLIAFAGDEEVSSKGASQVSEYLLEKKIHFKGIVLDVTNVGWDKNLDFTVENNFWNKKMGQKVIETVKNYSKKWMFVPEDPEDIPEYVSHNNVYYEEALEDESWEYDEYDVKCFSLCIPVSGNMHSNKGVYVRMDSLCKYIEVLHLLVYEKYD